MVRVTNPRECAQGTDDNSEVCDRTKNQDGIVVDLMIAKVVDDF